MTHDVDAGNDFIKFLVSLNLKIHQPEDFFGESVILIIQNHHQNTRAENHLEKVQHWISDALVQQILAKDFQDEIADSRNFVVVRFEKIEE